MRQQAEAGTEVEQHLAAVETGYFEDRSQSELRTGRSLAAG